MANILIVENSYPSRQRLANDLKKDGDTVKIMHNYNALLRFIKTPKPVDILIYSCLVDADETVMDIESTLENIKTLLNPFIVIVDETYMPRDYAHRKGFHTVGRVKKDTHSYSGKCWDTISMLAKLKELAPTLQARTPA